MAGRQNSSSVSGDGDDNFIDFDNEFEFSPSEWMVVDDYDELENEEDSLAQEENIEKPQEDKSKLKQSHAKMSPASECKTRSKTSNVPAGGKHCKGEIQSRKVTNSNSEAKKTQSSPARDKKSNDNSASSRKSISNTRGTRIKSQQKTNVKPGNESASSIADIFDKSPSVQKQSGKSAKSTVASDCKGNAKVNPSANTKTAVKGKSEEVSKSLPSTKVVTTTKVGSAHTNTAGKRKAEDSLKSSPSTKVVTTSKVGAANTNTAGKRKAEDSLKSSPSTKVLKCDSREQSKNSTPLNKGTSQNTVSSASAKSASSSSSSVVMTSNTHPSSSSSVVSKVFNQQPSSSMSKTSNQHGPPPTAQAASNRQVKIEVQVSPTAAEKMVNYKKQNVDSNTVKQPLAGGSIAEAMGVKIAENVPYKDVDDKDVIIDVAVVKKPGYKKSSDELVVSGKPNRADSSVSVSGPSQSSLKEETVTTTSNIPSETPSVTKKRIVRRFHRTTQTISPQVSNKLLQCLIKIPSLDWPKKPSVREIGLMTDCVGGLEKVSASSVVKNIAVKADTVAEDAFVKALSFGIAEDGTVPRKTLQGTGKYGIRICNILDVDKDKAKFNAGKADGYTLSFSSKNSGILDLFYEDEDAMVQAYNYFRKNRMGGRYVCISFITLPTVPEKKDKTAESIPGVTATIVMDQNHSSLAYLSYCKAAAWNKPKADVILSIHNVPKNVPVSLFNLIFPDAITVELDDPSAKITQETSNRVKLGIHRKGVDKFVKLFSQVIVNNNPLIITSGLTREEDVPEMKEILLKRKKIADENKNDRTVKAVPRDINAKKSKRDSATQPPETDILMQVENVESIDKVLTGRPGAWKGPSTPGKLRQSKNAPYKASKSRPKSSSVTKGNSEDLSDISDNSDFGDDVPQRKIMASVSEELGNTGSPDVLNRWRQTEPLLMLRRNRSVKESPSRRDSSRLHVESDERFVDFNKRSHPQRSRSSRDERDKSGKEPGRQREERQAGDRNNKMLDLNDADFDKRHKVIMAGQTKSDWSMYSQGGGGGEEDLRCMLENLKNRRSSKQGDGAESSSLNRQQSVEFVGRSRSPSEVGRTRHSRADHSRSPGRPERDRRVVSRKSLSPTPRRSGVRRTPSPFRPRHRINRGQERERQNVQRSSFSPPSGRERERQNLKRSSFSPPLGRERERQNVKRTSFSPPSGRERERQNLKRSSFSPPLGRHGRNRSSSPVRRGNRRSQSPLSRSRQQQPQHSRSRERDRPPKQSLSPILPFRPGQRNKEGREPTRQQHDQMRLRQSSPDSHNTPMKGRNSSRERKGSGRMEPTSSDQEIAMSKTLYNTLMDRLREKADVYSLSKDSNLLDAANVYSQINELAETLTAIKHDADAVKQFQMGLDSLEAQFSQQSNNNNSSSVSDPSKELHPDLLRYVNIKPGSGSGNNKPVDIPPPIPPPVAPPLFTSDSPTDKKAQLEAIAKQLVSDMKHQGSLGYKDQGGDGDDNRNTNQGRASGSQGDVSGGMWMVPPPSSNASGGGGGGFVGPPPIPPVNPMGGGVPPPLRAGPPPGPFSMPPPPVLPNMMPQHPMNMMRPPQPGTFNNALPPGFMPRGIQACRPS